MLSRGFFFLVFLLAPFFAAAGSDQLVDRLYREVVGEKENDPARNKRLADILERQGLREEALVYYKRAAENAPESVSCNLALARSLKDSDQIDEAILVYEKILQIAPENQRYTDEIINFLENAGRIEEAEAFYWKLITVSSDMTARLGVASRLAEFAVRNQKTDQLGDEFHSHTSFLPPSERAILRSQIDLQLGRNADARQILKEELSAELARNETPSSMLLARLVHVARQERDFENAREYSRMLYRLYPTAENRYELDISEDQFRNSPEKKQEYYVSHPEVFLDSLPQLLLNPQTRSETVSSALSLLPTITPEQLTSSIEGVVILFTEVLFPHPENWEEAASLWHTLWNKIHTFPNSSPAQEKFLGILTGIPPQLGKRFVPELTERFIADPGAPLFWNGFWSSQGWESLLGTLLQSEADTQLILHSLENRNFAPSIQQRAALAIDFSRGEFAKAWETFQLSGILNVPHLETLSEDWTILREMEKDPLPAHQGVLTCLYRDRLSLVAGTADEKFVLVHYRKAAFASQNPVLLKEAAMPLLEKLEHYFKLAERTGGTGNITITDPETGKDSNLNIYEILNTLLDTALELKSLGFSDEIVVFYRRYGEGKEWWTDLEGQGVYYFSELKKIIEDTE